MLWGGTSERKNPGTPGENTKEQRKASGGVIRLGKENPEGEIRRSTYGRI